ncbi:MAG: hypothetical protein AB1444_16085 [Spirochaetota bacterium]
MTVKNARNDKNDTQNDSDVKIPGQTLNDVLPVCHPEPCPEFISGLIQDL